MSCLTIDVTDQQHQRLKTLAALQGKTIKAYPIERLFAPDADEEQALMVLKALLEGGIVEAETDDVDTRSITEITEDVLNRGADV